MPTLTITPTPFRSSHLTIPPTPFTPRLPNSPPPSRPQIKPVGSSKSVALSVPPPPQEPLKWLWQCHCCSRIYHLGTTRRCLDDGHYFCAGAPITKRDRKTGLKVTRKSRACASEFDYQGWKSWGSWRRDVDEQRALAEALRIEDLAVDVVPKPLFAPTVPQEGQWLQGIWAKKPVIAVESPTPDFWGKDCWNTCDYPSECRWGKQFGAQQTRAQSVNQVPAVVVPSTTTTTTSTPPPERPASMVTEPVARDLEQPGRSFEGLPSIPAAIEEASETEGLGDAVPSSTTSTATSTASAATVQETTTKEPTFDDLLESAKRRKRRSAGPLPHVPSPLTSNPPSPVEAPESTTTTSSAHNTTSTTLQRHFDNFELDVRKYIGRASVLLNDFVLGLKNGNAITTSEDEKAEAFVRGLGSTNRQGRRNRKNREGREDGQSLSD